MIRVCFLIINIFLMSLTVSVFSQDDIQLQENKTDKNSKEESAYKKTEVVVNKKMLEKYNRFMDSGEYTSLWEAFKDNNVHEMSTFYQTYKNYAFSENTSYRELILAAEKTQKQIESEEALPVKPITEEVEYLTDFQKK